MNTPEVGPIPDDPFESQFNEVVDKHCHDGNLVELLSLMTAASSQTKYRLSPESQFLGWGKAANLAVLQSLHPDTRISDRYRLLSVTKAIIYQQLTKEDLANVVRRLRMTDPRNYQSSDLRTLMLLSQLMSGFCRNLVSFNRDSALPDLAQQWYRTGLRLTLPKQFVDNPVPEHSSSGMERYRDLSLAHRYGIWHQSLLQLSRFPGAQLEWSNQDPYFVNPLQLGFSFLSSLKRDSNLFSAEQVLEYQAAVTHFAHYLNHTTNVPHACDQTSADVDVDVMNCQSKLQQIRLPNRIWNLMHRKRPQILRPPDPSFFTYEDQLRY